MTTRFYLNHDEHDLTVVSDGFTIYATETNELKCEARSRRNLMVGDEILTDEFEDVWVYIDELQGVDKPNRAIFWNKQDMLRHMEYRLLTYMYIGISIERAQRIDRLTRLEAQGKDVSRWWEMVEIGC